MNHSALASGWGKGEDTVGAEQGIWKRLEIDGGTLGADVVEVYWAEEKTERGDMPSSDGVLNKPLQNLEDLGVDEDWKVVTTAMNHHTGFWPRIIWWMATVAPKERTVHLTLLHHDSEHYRESES